MSSHHIFHLSFGCGFKSSNSLSPWNQCSICKYCVKQILCTDLQYDIGQHHDKREGEVDQQPDLHRLDVGGAGQAGRHREVDGGQDHHAGRVDGIDHARRA